MFFLIVALIGFVALSVFSIRSAWETRKKHQHTQHLLAEAKVNQAALRTALDQAQEERDSLRPFAPVRDITAAVDALKQKAREHVDAANAEARSIRQAARQKLAEAAEDEAKQRVVAAQDAKRIVEAAEERAEAVAGEALQAVREADRLKAVIKAMQNTIQGYGDAYLKPSSLVLDELADDFDHKDAGKQIGRAHV